MDVVQGHDLQEGFAASGEAWDRTAEAPTLTVLLVAGLANPRFLVEIEAIAVR